MADGENYVKSPARAAFLVGRSLCARSSRPLLHAGMSCSAHSEPMSTQQRASADRVRVAIGDLSSASAEKQQQQQRNGVVAKMHPLESKCSHVTAPAWQGQFSQEEEANALSSSWWANADDDARRVNLPSSSLAGVSANFTFSHQTAADMHRKGGGMLEARAIRATVDRLLARLASCWKTEDRRRCSGHVLDSNISHVQYTYEVTVVWTSRRGPCKPGWVS